VCSVEICATLFRDRGPRSGFLAFGGLGELAQGTEIGVESEGPGGTCCWALPASVGPYVVVWWVRVMRGATCGFETPYGSGLPGGAGALYVVALLGGCLEARSRGSRSTTCRVLCSGPSPRPAVPLDFVRRSGRSNRLVYQQSTCRDYHRPSPSWRAHGSRHSPAKPATIRDRSGHRSACGGAYLGWRSWCFWWGLTTSRVVSSGVWVRVCGRRQRGSWAP